MRAASNTMSAAKLSASAAFSFVLTMGIVNLFGDLTYEGGASINGPFLQSLGASAAAVSIIAGVGEFFGYSLRLGAGYLADRTQKYWLVTFIGYAINLLAVPALALAGNWPVAAALVITERVGRAIRKPTVEAMLSYTTGKHGKGWVYGVNTALDEAGATIGPLVVALVLFLKGSYRTAYALLLVSVVLAFVSLTVARFHFPQPSRLETGQTAQAKGFTKEYWLNMAAGGCFAAGLMSFELISFHLSRTRVVPGAWIPVFLAISTGIGALASLLLGKMFDRAAMATLVTAVVLSSIFSPFVFLGGFYVALFGLILWGIGYATQDTLLKALVAGMLPEGSRSLAFGLYYAGYGVGWLAGSVVTGLLYEHSRPLLIGFSVIVQLASLPLFLIARKAHA
jgi:MFS family permease